MVPCEKLKEIINAETLEKRKIIKERLSDKVKPAKVRVEFIQNNKGILLRMKSVTEIYVSIDKGFVENEKALDIFKASNTLLDKIISKDEEQNEIKK